MSNDPQSSDYPRGWFVVAFSNEIPPESVKSLRYFGERLVAYRGSDSVVRVLDAYCSHMGADLGAGGIVRGTMIECPFHSWRFCGTGECVEIPYASRIPPKARQKAWISREVHGLILVYFDPAQREPDYEIPTIAEYGAADWLPWSQKTYFIKTHPREIVENIADKAHFRSVHRTEIDEFCFGVDGHTATQRVKGRALLSNGGVDSFSSTTTYYGPGYLVMRMEGALLNYMIVAHTPIDRGSVDLRMGVMLRVVGDVGMTETFVGGYLENLRLGFEDDIRIWENKLYREHPALCEGDGPIAQLRKWYRQFYGAKDRQARGATSDAASRLGA